MWRWVEHTGELEVEVEASTEEAVFAEALDAMAELLGGEDEPSADRSGQRLERAVTLRAADRAALFADWLAELAVLAETEGFVPDGVERLELDGGSLSALLIGHRGTPPHLVKAVTLHRILFASAEGGWRARAVLDV